MNETDLRSWLRKAMKDDVIDWIEPSLGSTLGAPDANIDVDGYMFPVELKWGKELKGRLIIKMRPAQIRYHTIARKKKRKTAIMIGYANGSSFTVEMVSNAWLDRMEPRYHIAHGYEDVSLARQRIRQCLTDKDFWK